MGDIERPGQLSRLHVIARRAWVCTNCGLGLVNDDEPANCGCWAGGPPTEYEEWIAIPAARRGAVSLTDEQWERVLWWLHTPTPPGPAKALDEAIIRAIANQRGQ